jgi:hypothetical protein
MCVTDLGDCSPAELVELQGCTDKYDFLIPCLMAVACVDAV